MVKLWEEEIAGKSLVEGEEEEVHLVGHLVWEVEEEEAEVVVEEAHQALNPTPGRRGDLYHQWQAEALGETEIAVSLLECVYTAATCQSSIALNLHIK
jgi:hypothetical protein